MIGVYKITNPVGAIYIGSSLHIEKRWKQYKYTYGSQHKIQNSIKKYGYENHEFEVLCYCSIDELLEKEAYYCLKYNVLDRCNLNLSIPKKGDVKVAFSEEIKEKISKAHKGKKLTDLQKEILLASTKGKKQTLEHINKRKMVGAKNGMFGKPSPMKGKKHTLAAREKFSLDRKGKKLMGENSNAKPVICITDNTIYSCAKEVSVLYGIKYSTLKSYLNGSLKNKTKFKYYERVDETTI